MTHRRFLLHFTALSLVASPALAQKTDLTAPPSAIQMMEERPAAPHGHEVISNLQQALQAAFIENPGLRAERASLRATQEEYPQAFANFLPTLSWDFSMNATNVRGDTIDSSTDGANTKEFGLNLDQPIFRGGSNFAEMSEAKNNISAAEAALLQEEQDIFLDVVTAYMNVIRDRRALFLQQQNEEILRNRLKDSEALFDAGELTRTDVSQSRARLSDAQSDRINAELDLNATIEQFINLTGRRPAETLEFPSIEVGIPEDLQEVQNTSLNYNPNIIESRHEHLSALSSAQVEYGALLPQVSLNAGYKNQIDPGPTNNKSRREQVIGIQVSVPFFQGGAQRSEVREAKITANQFKLEMMQAIQDIMEDTASTWKSYQSNGRIIELRKVQVQAARETRNSIEQEVEAGERTYIDLLDSDQDFIDAELNLLLAERDAVLDAYRLLTYMGQLNAEALKLNSDQAVYTHHANMDNLKSAKGYLTFDPYQDTEYPLKTSPKKPAYVRTGRAGTLEEPPPAPEPSNPQIPAPDTSNIQEDLSANELPVTDKDQTIAAFNNTPPVPKKKPDTLNTPSVTKDDDFDKEFEEFYNNLPSAEVTPVEATDITEEIQLSSQATDLNDIPPSAGAAVPTALETPKEDTNNGLSLALQDVIHNLKKMNIEKVSSTQGTASKEVYLNAATFDNYHMAVLISHELKKQHGVPTIISTQNGEYILKAGPFDSEQTVREIFGKKKETEPVEYKKRKKNKLFYFIGG